MISRLVGVILSEQVCQEELKGGDLLWSELQLGRLSEGRAVVELRDFLQWTLDGGRKLGEGVGSDGESSEGDDLDLYVHRM